MSSLLQQGKLRSALLDLAEDVTSGRMDEETRKSLIPILSRILFGRLSTRAGKAVLDDEAIHSQKHWTYDNRGI
jgi:hypothetical protein